MHPGRVKCGKRKRSPIAARNFSVFLQGRLLQAKEKKEGEIDPDLGFPDRKLKKRFPNRC
jgi:hypothetical protein